MPIRLSFETYPELNIRINKRGKGKKETYSSFKEPNNKKEVLIMTESVSYEISQIFSLSKAGKNNFWYIQNAGANIIVFLGSCRKDLNGPDFPQINSKFEISQEMRIR